MAKENKKDEKFLSQIPDWESNYKKNDDEVDINFEKKDWLLAKPDFTEHDLKIFGYAVMEYCV